MSTMTMTTTTMTYDDDDDDDKHKEIIKEANEEGNEGEQLGKINQ